MRRADPTVYCEGKDKHARGMAKKLAARINRNNSGANVGFYKCPNCGGWHLGSSPIGKK